MTTAGVILAGGKSSRFGANKAEALLLGRPLMDWAIARARPQVGALLVSAGESTCARLRGALPCVSDDGEPFQGPLAGICAAMNWVVGNGLGCRWIASFAVDTPFFPPDHVERLLAAAEGIAGCRAVIPASGGRDHPVFGLWPVAALPRLREALEKGERGVMSFARLLDAVTVPVPAPLFDPYFNVNTEEDLHRASEIAEARFGQTFSRVPSSEG